MIIVGIKKDTADEAIATSELPCTLTEALLLDSLTQCKKCFAQKRALALHRLQAAVL